MSSTSWPAASSSDHDALQRALAVVAEESFFAMVDAVPDGFTAAAGPMLSARVAFRGAFSGSLVCRMSRALAEELTAAFTGEPTPSEAAAVDDLAGEFANMVCGRWLTDTAPQSLFQLEHPVVVPIAVTDVASSAPSGVLNGQPFWVELTVEAHRG